MTEMMKNSFGDSCTISISSMDTIPSQGPTSGMETTHVIRAAKLILAHM
jgi:hypothetical protein